MITDDQIPAYNVPSGILFDMHREAAAKRPGVLTKVGHGHLRRPRPAGLRHERRGAAEPIVRKVEFAGDSGCSSRPSCRDVAIIRATTADERGNLSYEHEGAYLGALDQALAVAQQWRHRHRAGQAAGARPARSSRSRSTCRACWSTSIVVAPDQMQTTQTAYDPAISGEYFRAEGSFRPTPWGVDKVIARRAAQELRAGWAVNLGFGISAHVPRILLEEGRHGDVTWVIEQGAVGGVPLLDFQFGCSANAEAIMPSPQQFTYFQGGGFDCSLLSFMQIDQDGSVNVSRSPPSRT